MSMHEIEYLVDKKGRRKSIVISCKRYEELMEDIADLRAKLERRNETPEDLEKVLADLENAGRI